MGYTRSLLLYQDKPAYGLFLKLIMIALPGALLITSIYLFSSSENTGGLVLLAEAFIVGLIFWSVFPRSYQVYEDHLRIVLGGPFSIKVGFDKIEAISVTSRPNIGINFVKCCVYFRMHDNHGNHCRV